MTVLVDTNILIDIILDDEIWAERSLRAIRQAAQRAPLAINIIVYAELAAGYGNTAQLDALMVEWNVALAEIPREAALLAGQAFKRYRQSGGTRTGVLSDFFIGAHADAGRLPLLTRDVKRYRTYFPRIELIVPTV
ncbi:MAG: type II toxin-antitoxin system VapC family toxin [Beijerinckiaceae bacterium]|nr:type II toxin-antitoxin system VapC family toxin [Beijerinckiaceae bacterium]